MANRTKKRVAWFVIIAVAVIALAAVAMWRGMPRPLMDREKHYTLYRATYWDGRDQAELSGQVDGEAVLDVLTGYQRNVGSSGNSYQMDTYPIELSFDYAGGSWHVVAGPEGAFAYDSAKSTNWRILDGERLWTELTPLLPLEG